MSTSCNLNKLVPWSRLSTVLGLTPHSPVLPSRSSCPLCSAARFTVYADDWHAGEWFHCQDCQQAGDMPQLAAKVWQLSLLSTLVRLREVGFPLPLDRKILEQYIQVFPERRRQTAVFWAAARQRHLHNSTTASRLVQELKLTCDVSAERYNRGPQRLFSYCHVQEAEALLRPNNPESHRSDKTSWTQFNGGQSWGDLLIFPFRDLPQRICGLLHVGRDADRNKDFIFRLLHSSTKGPAAYQEAGLSYHPDALHGQFQWGNKIIALRDPILAAKLQCKHFEQSQRALPLVAWYSTHHKINRQLYETRLAWNHLYDRELVFWLPRWHSPTISQAIRQNGWLTVMGPQDDTPEGWRQYMSRMSPEELVTKLCQQAQPWREVLHDLVIKLTDSEVEDLCRRLELDGLSPAELLDRCPAAIRQRIQNAVRVPLRGRLLESGKHGNVFSEERDSWWVQKSPRRTRQELVSNAILRVEEVLHYVPQDYREYRGRILFRGRQYPFQVLSQLLDEQPWKWLPKFLLSQQATGLVLNTRFKHELLTLAFQFHEPQHSTVDARVGWQVEQQQFVFPKFDLQLGGEVRERPLLAHLQPQSCADWKPPQPLSGMEMTPLTRSAVHLPPLWATLQSFLHNVLAPAYRRETLGLAGAGHFASSAEQLLRTLGCLSNKRYRHEPVINGPTLSNWPSLGDSQHTRGRYYRDMREKAQATAPNAWLRLRSCEYDAFGVYGGWLRVSSDEHVALDDGLLQAWQRFTAAYLQDLLRRRLILRGDMHKNWLTALNQDLQQFVQEQGYPTIMLQHSLYYLRESQPGCPLSLASLLHRNYAYRRQHRAFELRLAGSGLFLPQALYHSSGGRLATANGTKAVPLPAHCITAALQNAGALLQVQPQGWIIQTDWWYEIFRQYAQRPVERVTQSRQHIPTRGYGG